MSSSDLELREELQPFELADSAHCDGPLPCESSTEDLTSQPPSSLNGHKVRMMSLQDFQQLPAMPEDCELPALWEDGGAMGSRREGYSTGASFGDGLRWSSFSDDSVKIFEEDGDGNADNAGDRTDESLEQKSTLVEETLSQIYASPFQHMIYASSPPSSMKHSPRSPCKTTAFKTPSSAQHKDRVSIESAEGKVPDSSNNDDGEVVLVDEVWDRLEEAANRIRLDHDAHSSMKASIARAAQKAVSGYRTCDDADNYVGTRFKPTLILARAPPSPSGILRRTSKKSAAKAVTGSVRWADGRTSSLPPTDDTT